MYLEALKRKHKKEESLSEGDEDELERKPVFSAEAIKRIGYDPSAKRGQFSKEEDQKRVSASLSIGSKFMSLITLYRWEPLQLSKN